MDENRHLETMRILEVDRLREEAHAKWLEREAIAQIQWHELQEKLKKAKEEKFERDLRIRQEWENEQQKLKEAKEKILQAKIERENAQRELDDKITKYLDGLSVIPKELLVVLDTKPSEEQCPFYIKTGVCRFGDDCSRNHRKLVTGKILLAQNLYTSIGLEQSKSNEYYTDVYLEYDDLDAYRDFRDFFYDVLPEFEKFGEILQFKVCRNREKHLRGNTYIEFASTRSAIKAQRAMHARWYGGRQMSLQFCSISSWRSAICGLANRNRCPKGLSCNFLHVFRNPSGRFELPNSQSSNRSHSSSQPRRSRSPTPRNEMTRNWRWSESPEVEILKNDSESKSRKSKRRQHKENVHHNHRKKRKHN